MISFETAMELPATAECYSYQDGRGGEFVFSVLLMQQHALSSGMPVNIIDIDHDFAEWVAMNCGVETDRLERMDPACLATPLLMVTMPPMNCNPLHHLIVDGHHRYVKASRLGWSELPAYIYPEAEWDRFVFDIPDHLKTRVGQVVRSHPSNLPHRR